MRNIPVRWLTNRKKYKNYIDNINSANQSGNSVSAFKQINLLRSCSLHHSRLELAQKEEGGIGQFLLKSARIKKAVGSLVILKTKTEDIVFLKR